MTICKSCFSDHSDTRPHWRQHASRKWVPTGLARHTQLEKRNMRASHTDADSTVIGQHVHRLVQPKPPCRRPAEQQNSMTRLPGEWPTWPLPDAVSRIRNQLGIEILTGLKPVRVR